MVGQVAEAGEGRKLSREIESRTSDNMQRTWGGGG